MQLTCRYTGLSITTPAFAGHKAPLPWAHPVVMLDVNELNKLASLQTTLEEDRLLLVGYMANLGTVVWQQPCNIQKLSEEFISQALPKTLQLANWAKGITAKKLAQLPRYTVDHTALTTGLHNWLDYLEIMEGFKEVGRFRTGDESSNLTDDDLEQIRQMRRAITQRRATQANNFKRTVAWAADIMQLLAPDEEFCAQRHGIFIKLMHGAHYPHEVMSSYKAKVLAFLPETKHDDYLKKQSIIQKLDDMIVKAIGTRSALGFNTEAELETLEAIQASYTIHVGGEEILNSAVPVVKTLQAVKATMNNGLFDTLEPSVIAIPASEPKREDYPTFVHYNIARQKWINQGK